MIGHGGHESVELLAAVVLVVGGGIVTLRMFLTRPRRTGPAASSGRGPEPGHAQAELPSVRRSLSVILAGLSGGAAVIHLAAAPSHYVELGDLGAGFLVAAAFQAAWIRWCLAGPSRRAALVGITGNVAIALTWAYTRTIGLPIGPFAGGPEPVGLPDGASVAFEALIVLGLLPVVRKVDLGAAHRRLLREAASIAIVPVVGLVIVVTSLATVAIAAALDHGADAHVTGAHVGAP